MGSTGRGAPRGRRGRSGTQHTVKEDRNTIGPAAGVTVYQLRVTLRDISPLVWRRLLVRSDTTIAQLHEVLQIAMGWEDVHLQQFLIHGKASGVYHDGGLTFADNPRQVRLADFRLRRGERFLYEYDFGDGWQHDIWLEQALPLDERRSYPACTAGHGPCPPEDCGGPAGYAAFMWAHRPWAPPEDVEEAMAILTRWLDAWWQGGPRPTDADEEYGEALDRLDEWLDEMPEAFSRRQVNAALRERRDEWARSSVSRS